MVNIFKTNKWNRIRYTFWLPVYNLTVSQLDKPRKRSIELSKIQSYEKVLIVGGGSGLDLKYLKNCKHITITDITPGMIAKSKNLALSIGMEITAEVMDGQALTFPDNTFDVVILHLILAVIPDPNRCISEAERVLKPGGRIAVMDKFLKAERPGLLRRIVNPFSIILFTDINRKLSDIISVTKLKIVHDEPSLLNGFFRIIQLRKER